MASSSARGISLDAGRRLMESLVLRPARAGDREGMLRITKGVWGGTDYVPYRWQRWLEDACGYLCVATLNGEVVGLHHTSVQSDGSAWLEGIRVDETLRGRGIGAAMLRNGLGWARIAGCSIARLSTSNENESSMQIARKAGLHEVGRYDVLSGPPADPAERGVQVRLAHAGDLEMLGGLLLNRHPHENLPRFYTKGWTAYRLDAKRLHLLVAAHAVAMAEANDAVSIGIATASVGRPQIRLGYLQGPAEGARALASWVQARAGATGMEEVRAILPSEISTRELLQSLGFTASTDFSMVLWETTL
jgi:GNAT superfamily N-acetyltransferase